MQHHYPRYAIKNVEEALMDTPVVFVAGPRQCGKTTLVKNVIDHRWQYITLDDQTQYTIAKADPVGFITNLKASKIALDEIQRVPDLLLTIKQIVDESRSEFGHFLLTGSSNVLVLPQVLDSLAGRIETIMLNTLSECEINNTQPSFLSTLLAGQSPQNKTKRIRDYLINRIVTGCYPEPLTRTQPRRVQAWYKQYVKSLIQKDVKDIDHIAHPKKMQKLLQLTAYYSAKLINFSEIGSMLELDRITTKKYLSLLEHLFLINELPAWHTNEYKRLIKTPKLHIVDTGLACAIRNITKETLQQSPIELGFLLETFVYNELRKQAEWIDDTLTFYHYRDKDQVEVDFIIENAGGDCYAIEVKASATLNERDFSGLHRFKNIAGNRFKCGILLYDGDHTAGFGENIFAVPFSALWER